jgi:formylglycine-generating enzyme required for sulfatase activity
VEPIRPFVVQSNMTTRQAAARLGVFISLSAALVLAAEPDLSRNSLGMRFARIPGGTFQMGSNVMDGEKPVHTVSVPTFWIGVTEVTQAQWKAVMGNNPSYFQKAGPDAPVEQVSWDDVQAFVRKVSTLERDRSYRLPSEAEWEYACRAGTKEDPYGPAEAIAWVKENSGGTTHPVGQKRPNAFGLFDMLGNVSEWTEDTWHPDYKGAPTDGSAWEGGGSSYHTLRGGGWDLPAFFIHSALRGPYDPIHRLGFRVVCLPVNRGR